MQDSEVRRGKIKLTIGSMRFSGEGDQDWLDQHISKLIETFSQTEFDNSVDSAPTIAEPNQVKSLATESLATYLRVKGGDTVQNERFLATAGWLSRRGQKVLTTGAVTRALRDNQQKRLGNASDCLNQNVGKGFCEKTTGGFSITLEGWGHLGEEPNS